jgi:hypothetical protein
MSHIVWNISIFRVFIIDENSGWLGNACFACHCRTFCVTIAVTVVIGYVGARLVGCWAYLYVYVQYVYVRRSLFRFAMAPIAILQPPTTVYVPGIPGTLEK